MLQFSSCANRPDHKSPNHQITKSPNYSITKLPDYQIPDSLMELAMMCRYGTGVIALALLAASSAGVSAADQVKTANGVIEGADGERRARVQRHSVRGAAGRRSALEGAAAGPELDGRAPGNAVRPAMHAAADFRRHEFPLERHERGLPVPERVDAREVGRRAAAGARLLLRRRVHRPATAPSRATTA